MEGEIAVSDRVYALDPAEGPWVQAGTLPNLAGAAMVAAGDAVCAGRLGRRTYARRGVAHRAPERRQRRAALGVGDALNTPIAFFGATVAGNRLYVIGRYDGQRALVEAAAFDLETGQWQRLPPMSVPRSGLTAVYDGMAVFALGGGWTRAIDTHERYDAYANQWSNFPSPSAESGADLPRRPRMAASG